MEKIKVIGIGGGGCLLLEVLARFLNFRKERYEVTLIDGDSFEKKNQERQSFLSLGNKAKVKAEELAKKFGEVHFKHKPIYMSEETVDYCIKEGDIVFLCVDNHASRKIASDHCETLSDVTLISGGNEHTDGNIQIHIRRKGKDITLPIANSYHPEIQDPQDLTPEDAPPETDCQTAAKSSPQIIITNNTVVALELNAFYAILEKNLDKMPDEVYFEIITNCARPVNRRKFTKK